MSFRDARVKNISPDSVGKEIANKLDKIELPEPKSLLERNKGE